MADVRHSEKKLLNHDRYLSNRSPDFDADMAIFFDFQDCGRRHLGFSVCVSTVV